MTDAHDSDLDIPTADELFGWAPSAQVPGPQSESSVAWDLADQQCAKLIADAMLEEPPQAKKEAANGRAGATLAKTCAPDVEGFFNQSETAPPANETNGHKPSFEPPSPMDAGGKVAIDVSCDHLPTMSSLSWEAVKRENDPPVLFRYNNIIVRISRDDDGGVCIETVTPEILRHHLANWGHWHKHEVKLALPPLHVVKDVLVTPDPPLPILRRVISAPVFTADGSLLLKPGYDKNSGLYYAPPPGFKALLPPKHVTDDDVQKAVKYLDDNLFADFPFASQADKCHAHALLDLPFVREMIPGPTPNHLIEAPLPGSGKGLMAKVCLNPSLGEFGVKETPQPEDDAEWRKVITSALTAGKQVFLIDNVSRKLDSGEFASALTSNIWEDRILGSSRMVSAIVRLIWVTTANNPELSSEITRRSIPIRLAPNTDTPEDRTEFKHKSILKWIAENRAEIVRAVHIIVLNWIQAGRPDANVTLGSYDDWARVMGGILRHAGIPGFLQNRKELRERADVERTARAAFCDAWYQKFEPKEQDTEEQTKEKLKWKRATAKELYDVAKEIEGLPLAGQDDHGRNKSFGRYLATCKDVCPVYVEKDEEGKKILYTRRFRITQVGTRKKALLWSLDLLEES